MAKQLEQRKMPWGAFANDLQAGRVLGAHRPLADSLQPCRIERFAQTVYARLPYRACNARLIAK